MITREIERAGLPIVQITAMSMLAKQFGVSRIVTGTGIPHPCGDPGLSPEADLSIRREIVETALRALQTNVGEPTVFTPKVVFSVA